MKPSWSRMRRAAVVGVCAAGLLQIALGLGGLVASAAGVEWQPPTAVRDWHRLVQVLAFGGLGGYLLLGARRDARIEYLGATYLLIAVFFAHPPIQALLNALSDPWRGYVSILRSFTVDAFTPALLWLFFRDFPRALESSTSARVFRLAISASVVAAAGLIAVNLALGSGMAASGFPLFDRTNPTSHYWTVVFGLLLPVPAVVVWRARHAPRDERGRLRIFTSGFGFAAILPILIAVVPAVSLGARELIMRPAVTAVVIPLNQLMVFAVAATATYAVAVQRVLPVRTVLRKAAQYSITRLFVGALSGLPFAGVGAILYQARGEPLAALLSGARPLLLAGLLGGGVAALRLRGAVMLGVDRLFFREPYDPRQLLVRLADAARDAESIASFAEALVAEIDRTLHLETSGLLIHASDGADYLPLAGATRRLSGSSGLVGRLCAGLAPLHLGVGGPSSQFAQLGEDDRLWVVDCGAEVLVPLVASMDAMAAILVLGPKRSGLPFSREDMLMLSAVASAAGTQLENRRLRELTGLASVGRRQEAPAQECVACGNIEPAGAGDCTECAGKLRPGRLPRTLFEKFRLDRRIGEGGMGVVYRGTDLALDRPVALKTLPATSPEDSVRLRREARAMAAITHPNLALIFGAETWLGTPIIVMEYLPRGTLADRLASSPMGLRPALEICQVIASVLARAHAVGILHRDVKPSNIGFAEGDVPKLLDFGLVQIAGDRAPPAYRWDEALGGSVTETGPVGTLVYMSSEALEGRRPGPDFDLWSLSVVAFEAATGRHPFERSTTTETLDAIYTGWTPDLAKFLPACPQPVLELFAKSLSSERSRRPNAAAQLARWYQEGLAALAGRTPV